MTDIDLRILMSASAGNVMSVIGGLAGAGGVGGLVGVLGVLTAAMGVQSVKAATSFQSAMDLNVAHAGLAKDQFNAVSDAVLNMAPQVGKGPTELAQSLYPILSGLSGMTDQAAKTKVALAELRDASESVAGTTTSTTAAANAGTAVFNALGLATGNASKDVARMNMVFDQANATVTAGNMQWEQYANVAGKLATSIKGTTVTWTEASAALATLTNEGFSAQRSQTYLSNLFTQLDLKTDSLAKHAKQLNITFDEQRFKSMSLAQQLDYLKQITGGNESEMLKLLNNNATALKSYNALESGMNSYKSNLQSIGHAQGTTARAFADATSNEAGATARLKAAFDVLLIRVGNLLLPALTALENAMTPVVIALANGIVASQSLASTIADFLAPALAKLTQASIWLGYYFREDMSRSTDYLRGKMYDLWDQMAGHGKLLDTFQQSTNWMIGIGMPVYTAYAAVVGDVLGGAYQKLGRDAMSAALSVSLAALKVDESLRIALTTAFKNINWPALFAGIPLPQGGLLGALFGPIGFGGGGIASLFQKLFGGINFHAIFQPFIDEWNQVMQDLMPSFIQFALWWQNTMGPLFKGLGDAWGGTKDGVKGAIPPLKQVLDILGHVFEFMAKVNMIIIEEVLPNTIKFFTWLGDALFKSGGSLHWLWTGITAFTTWLSGDGASYVRSLFDLVGKIFLGIGSIVTWLVTVAFPAVQRIWGGIGEWAGAIWLMIVQFWGLLEPWLWALAQGIKWVTDTIDSIPGRVADALDTVWWAFSDVLGKIHQAWGTIGKWFQDRGGDINNGITQALNGIGSWFHDHVTQPIQDTWNTCVQWFQSHAIDIANAITGALSGIGTAIENAFRGALNWVIGGINRIIDGYNNVPKFGIPNIPDIPQLASGGYLTSSGIVDVHANERLFLPAGTAVAGPGSALARGSGRGGGGHTFNITINAPFGSSSDVGHLADLLEMELARRFRTQTPSYGSGIAL